MLNTMKITKCISFLHGKRLLCNCSSFLPSCFSTLSRCWDALPPERVFFVSAQPVCRRTAHNSIRIKLPATNKMPKSKSHFHTTALSNILIQNTLQYIYLSFVEGRTGELKNNRHGSPLFCLVFLQRMTFMTYFITGFKLLYLLKKCSC